MNDWWVCGLIGPEALTGHLHPSNQNLNHGSPAHLLKFKVVPRLRFLTASGSRKNETRRWR